MAVNATATVLDDDTVEIISAGSTSADIAAALLSAADDPAQVVTVTTSTGLGWRVPTAVARKAGLLSTSRRSD